MSYHYNVYLLCYSRHVGHSSHVQSILAIVQPILVCQDVVAGQQRILIISSAYGFSVLRISVALPKQCTGGSWAGITYMVTKMLICLLCVCICVPAYGSVYFQAIPMYNNQNGALGACSMPSAYSFPYWFLYIGIGEFQLSKFQPFD